MALACRDFSPRAISSAHARHLQWEALPAVIERVNQWLASAGIRAVNVETLLLPATRHNLPNPAAGGHPEQWDEDHSWVQVVRVWYELPPTGVPASPPPAPLRPVDSVAPSAPAPSEPPSPAPEGGGYAPNTPPS